MQGRYWPGPLPAPGAAHLQFSLQHLDTSADKNRRFTIHQDSIIA